MSRRHRLTRSLAAAVLAVSSSACGARGGLALDETSDAGGGVDSSPGAPADAATPRPRDAGVRPPVSRDSGTTSRDAATRWDAGTCEVSREGIGIELVPSSTVARCADGHHEGVAITAVLDEPTSDGIRLRADLCPDADADCRCDTVVSSTGAVDLSRLPFPRGSLTIDVDRFHLVVRKLPTCRCDGCGCDLSLAFLAAHEDPDRPRDLPPEIAFARGSAACPATDPCTRTDTFRLGARALGHDVELDEGTEQTFGPVTVRNVRDAVGFDVCAACADCGAVRGSFLAWTEADRAGP